MEEYNGMKALEEWWAAKKGRYVNEINIGNTYGATCWSVILGNTNVKAGDDWFFGEGWAEEHKRAEVHVDEIAFFERTGADPGYPNVVDSATPDNDTFCGLGKTIRVAIEHANKMGL